MYAGGQQKKPGSEEWIYGVVLYEKENFCGRDADCSGFVLVRMQSSGASFGVDFFGTRKADR